jgi:predicted  nucleic acid-binding Zn-ribbon protein
MKDDYVTKEYLDKRLSAQDEKLDGVVTRLMDFIQTSNDQASRERAEIRTTMSKILDIADRQDKKIQTLEQETAVIKGQQDQIKAVIKQEHGFEIVAAV